MRNRSAFLLTILFILSLGSLKAQNQNSSANSAYKMPNTQVIPIRDDQSGGLYELYIKLPEAYSENPEKPYPVIYFTDAVWHMDILSASAEYIMEDVILVGISWQKDIDQALVEAVGAHVSRHRDYTVEESSNPEIQAKYQLGQASRHLAFIRNQVIEYVESHFPTDPDNRSYFGYSVGGVFGAYVLLSQPDTFKHYVLGSPALRGDIPYFTELNAETASKGQGLNANIFISYGTEEDELKGYADQFIDLLNGRNDESLNLQHEVIEGTHQTAFPYTGIKSVKWLTDLVKK